VVVARGTGDTIGDSFTPWEDIHDNTNATLAHLPDWYMMMNMLQN
jgi:hypothetical protein